MSLKNQPLVSVGIPTFNRPDGLKRTLELITAQTYQNLEIIISDNATNGDGVELVIEPFLKSDKRIKFYKQLKNEGAAFNFKFVLEQSSGEFFMWAADDDSWDLSIIEFYLCNIKNYGACFCSYSIRTPDQILIAEDLPILNGYTNIDQIQEFVCSPCPSMVYGMFIRKNLIAIYEDFSFDWGDCFFLIKYIYFFGYKTIKTDKRLYMAGVSSSEYSVKTKNKKYLNPWIFFYKTLPYILPAGYKTFMQHFRFCKNAWNNRYNLIRTFQ